MVSRRGVKACPMSVNYLNGMIIFGLFAIRKCEMKETGSEKMPNFQRV